MTTPPAAPWGFIDKRDRASDLDIWTGVEPCISQAQGTTRAAELEAANPGYEYRASRFLDLPLWVSRTQG
jgi:hypothetical protein